MAGARTYEVVRVNGQDVEPFVGAFVEQKNDRDLVVIGEEPEKYPFFKVQIRFTSHGRTDLQDKKLVGAPSDSGELVSFRDIGEAKVVAQQINEKADRVIIIRR